MNSQPTERGGPAMQLWKPEDAIFIWLPRESQAQEYGELVLRDLNEDSRAVCAKAQYRQASISWEKTTRQHWSRFTALCGAQAAQPHSHSHAFLRQPCTKAHSTTYPNLLLCIRNTHDSLFCMRT